MHTFLKIECRPISAKEGGPRESLFVGTGRARSTKVHQSLHASSPSPSRLLLLVVVIPFVFFLGDALLQHHLEVRLALPVLLEQPQALTAMQWRIDSAHIDPLLPSPTYVVMMFLPPFSFVPLAYFSMYLYVLNDTMLTHLR